MEGLTFRVPQNVTVSAFRGLTARVSRAYGSRFAGLRLAFRVSGNVFWHAVTKFGTHDAFRGLQKREGRGVGWIY